MTNYIARKELNEEKNGIEIYFNVFPITATRENLKKNGFKWNHKKKCWYAKQNTTTLSFASICAETTKEEYKHFADNAGEVLTDTKKTEKPKAKKTDAKPKTINLENLGEKPEGFSYYHSELSKLIREDLKRRGVDGVTVRAGRGGYTASITVTIKATADDIASIEEMSARFTESDFFCAVNRHGVYTGEKWLYLNEYEAMTDEQKKAAYISALTYQTKKDHSANIYHLINCRNDYYEFTTEFFNKLVAVFLISNQWNYDNSDSMTDYFDVGYYLDIDIKTPENVQIRETMTDEERKAYAAEIKAQEEKEAAEMARIEQERKEAEERRKAYEEQEKKDTAAILADITVEDIEPLYISNLSGGIGKECNLDELNENIGATSSDAVITRKATFSNMDIFETFGKYLLNDWDFVAGKGGTASEDSRLTSENIHHLNEGQRKSIKWYMCDCIGVYVNNELMLVINPEGYSYPRYCYKPTEDTTTAEAAGVLEDHAKASEALPPFYFPEPVEKQAADLHAGQQITIYQCDGWILSSVYDNAGTIADIAPGDYAQYKGLYITFANGKRSFIRDNHDCLIYEGIKPRLPEEVTSRRISANMCEMFNYDELFPRILEYYSKQGIHPIVDTIQR